MVIIARIQYTVYSIAIHSVCPACPAVTKKNKPINIVSGPSHWCTKYKQTSHRLHRCSNYNVNSHRHLSVTVLSMIYAPESPTEPCNPATRSELRHGLFSAAVGDVIIPRTEQHRLAIAPLHICRTQHMEQSPTYHKHRNDTARFLKRFRTCNTLLSLRAINMAVDSW